MALDTAEHEQVETIKRFWRENGKSLIGGVLIGLAVLFSYQAWQTSKNTTAEAASAEYIGLMDSVSQGNWESAEAFGNRIVSQYADTTYGALAALAMAKVKLEQNDAISARAHLQWAIDKAKMPEIEEIAKIRLAKLLLSEGEPEQALNTIQGVKGEEFVSMRKEVLGDIHLALGNKEQARQAYEEAKEAISADGGKRISFIQMKLDDI